tara:strand:+ start:2284 stop:2655 length:372 start_codon:yes stop_codon:yes gene_type:complete
MDLAFSDAVSGTELQTTILQSFKDTARKRAQAEVEAQAAVDKKGSGASIANERTKALNKTIKNQNLIQDNQKQLIKMQTSTNTINKKLAATLEKLDASLLRLRGRSPGGGSNNATGVGPEMSE